MVYLGAHHLAHTLLVLLEDGILLQLQDAAGQILPQRQHIPPSEGLKWHFFRHFLAYLEVILDFQGIAEGNLRRLILHLAILDDFSVLPNLQIALIRVDDDVEVRVVPVLLLNHRTEDILEDAHHYLAVDVLELLEFLEGINQIEMRHQSCCVLFE